MKIRLLILLTALPFMLFGMTASLRAQQPEMAPATRRVIIFVWDGLRADDLTPELHRTTSRLRDLASSLQTTMLSIRPSR